MTENRALLASDLDGTLIPLDQHPARAEEIAALSARLENRPGLVLAYVTGRDFALALKGIREHSLPSPHWLVCDVGTSVYHASPEGYELDQVYARLMEEARGGLTDHEIRRAFDPLPGLEPQPEDRQAPFKVSYFLPAAEDHAALRQAVDGALLRFDGWVQAVYSVRPHDGMGLLDLLPGSVAKDHALHYLRERTGVDPNQVVYAGDSGNDLDAMLAGFKVIVVGNARLEFVEELTARAREEGLLPRFHFARAPFAAGVLEGCVHHGIL